MTDLEKCRGFLKHSAKSVAAVYKLRLRFIISGHVFQLLFNFTFEKGSHVLRFLHRKVIFFKKIFATSGNYFTKTSSYERLFTDHLLLDDSNNGINCMV